jgi:hypothetical protein
MEGYKLAMTARLLDEKPSISNDGIKVTNTLMFLYAIWMTRRDCFV